ncbi:CAP domain-containing protein [Nocardioides dongxiaopingii]|uniref:CAP domain-containing protein n=1 Tax=Nocardioides sp. S-1144 TaxID=2582905 RepID=UPI00110ECB69|nr:CAP domain-containing protein [Nocardioides sp. S-1144]QCW50764.1 CAP domain-containing protein [Nocardioides sp. S-1144]
MSRPHPPLALLVPALLVVALLAPAARAAADQTPPSPATVTATVTDASRTHGAPAVRLGRVLELVNRARSQARTCGGVEHRAVPRIVREARLDRAAGRFARLMARRDFVSHESPDGSDPGDRIRREGYRWTSYGENVAAGQATPAAVVRAWLGSPGHCAVIMSPFREIGIGHGHRAGATYRHYWVLDLASRRGRG